MYLLVRPLLRITPCLPQALSLRLILLRLIPLRLILLNRNTNKPLLKLILLRPTLLSLNTNKLLLWLILCKLLLCTPKAMQCHKSTVYLHIMLLQLTMAYQFIMEQLATPQLTFLEVVIANLLVTILDSLVVMVVVITDQMICSDFKKKFNQDCITFLY